MSTPHGGGEPVRLHVHGRSRTDSAAVEQLAHELTAQTRSQPGVLSYRWSRAVNSDRWLIEEEYSGTEAFGEHMAWMASSGQMRNLGGAFKVEEVLILSGDADLVGSHLGPLPQAIYAVIDAL